MEQTLEPRLSWISVSLVTLELLVTQWLTLQLAESPAAIEAGIRFWTTAWAILTLGTVPLFLQREGISLELNKLPRLTRGFQYVAAVPMVLGYLAFFA